MNEILLLAVKATLAMVVTFALVALARRSRASLRHLLFTSLFAFLLLLPVASRYVPAKNVEVQPVWSAVAPATALVPRAAETTPSPIESGSSRYRTPNWKEVYAAVSALLLAWLAMGVWRLKRLAAKGVVWLEGTARMNELAAEAGIRRAALVILSRESAVPLTFGFRRSTIILPESARTWSDDELCRALRHELEHVRREDWAAQLMARAACAVYWAHPLVWIAWRRFCFEAERACDDAVVGTYANAEDYAGQLVTLAKRVRFSTVPALGMASRSRLSQRVHALLDPSQRRGPLSGFATAIIFGATLVMLVTIAPARLIAAAEDRDELTHERPWSRIGEAMAEAAEAGKIDIIRQYLDAGIDVNTVAHGDGTALIGAARGGHVELVRFLIERGADVNLASPGDGNPLIAAAEKGSVEIVEILLDEGANIDEIVPGDENPIIQAAWNGHEDVVRLLIDRGADVNAYAVERGEMRTALRMAKKSGHDHIANMLIDAGATH